MRKTRILPIFIFLMLHFMLTTLSYSYEIISDSISKHIEVLAHDSLEGREVGERGEWKAAQYIKDVFDKSGIISKGTENSYFQPFDFVKRIDFGENTRLVVNGTELILNEDYQPMRQSVSSKFEFSEIINVDYGIVVYENEGSYNDYEGKDVSGKAVLIKRYGPSSEDNPHIDFDKYISITDKLNNAIEHNASAVFFITPPDYNDSLNELSGGNINAKDIPIVYIRRNGLEKLALDLNHPAITTITGETDMVRTRDTSRNVVAYVPGRTDTTVIIGAHYDHLGWGYRLSFYQGEEKMIHNGADDNASGVAALLELARYYNHKKDNLKYSLLFIAFAGEEFGLLGSNNFAKDMTVDSSKVRMMINLDMIGRLNEQKNGLAIIGTGTCTEFETYFDSLKYDELMLSLKKSGSAPSDHTPFYNRNIPSLFFFTGAHEDYHRPSDDVDKIDSDGIVKVTGLIRNIIDYFDTYDGSLTFQKTEDSGEGKHRSKYSVTLGITPDYVAEVKGLRIDGVSENRPGAAAGIQTGDIVIKMGDIIINDIYDYMGALGKFRKGDSIIVEVVRGSDTLSLPVIF